MDMKRLTLLTTFQPAGRSSAAEMLTARYAARARIQLVKGILETALWKPHSDLASARENPSRPPIA